MPKVRGKSFRLLPLLMAMTLWLSVLALSGCGSPVPVAVTYPLTLQQKIQSAAHWQMVATDMWREVSDRLEASGYHETSIGLEPPAQQTPFTRAMDDFLFTEIINHGVAVNPNSEFTLTYQVQVVHYGPDRDGPASPGLFATAGIGLLTWDGWKEGWGIGEASAAGLPLAAGADFMDGWTTNTSQTEMVLTVSVTDGTSVRLRESKVYYLNDQDAKLYESDNAASVEKSPLVTSNWYAGDPHEVDAIALAEANQFSLMIDSANGPLHDINEATRAAVTRCGDLGKSQSKFIRQSYPDNDRLVIKATFECQ